MSQDGNPEVVRDPQVPLFPETETSNTRDRPLCARCNADTDDCTCVECEGCGNMVAEFCDNCTQCHVCNEWNDDCECDICANCDERFRRDMNRRNGGCESCHVCLRCINNGEVSHYTCGDCGECLSEDALVCNNCGTGECCARFSCEHETHCNRCCECNLSPIRDYSCREYPSRIPSAQEVPKGFLWLGVELETECGDYDREEAAKTLDSKFSRYIILKEDGSLDNGIEIVTGPFGLSTHKKIWSDIAQCAMQEGLRSWKHATTGMHVHLSRAFFSPLALDKFYCFINSENPEVVSAIKRLAGRGPNSYCLKEPKKLGAPARDGDRYQAVNLTRTSTVEVRIFKGTLKVSHILANIEFCHALACYVSQVGITEYESFAKFLDYASTSPKEYRHLLEFFDRRKQPQKSPSVNSQPLEQE